MQAVVEYALGAKKRLGNDGARRGDSHVERALTPCLLAREWSVMITSTCTVAPLAYFGTQAAKQVVHAWHVDMYLESQSHSYDNN